MCFFFLFYLVSWGVVSFGRIFMGWFVRWVIVVEGREWVFLGCSVSRVDGGGKRFLYIFGCC